MKAVTLTHLRCSMICDKIANQSLANEQEAQSKCEGPTHGYAVSVLKK